jgi:two-component system response regulator PilR (NtrC family)
MLADAILKRIAAANGTGVASLSPDAVEALSDYSFPGNVRELENILERACALSDGLRIDRSDLQINAPPRAPRMREAGTSLLTEVSGDLDAYLADIERNVLTEALEAHRWNRTEAAQSLGIGFRSLRYRLKKLGIDD